MAYNLAYMEFQQSTYYLSTYHWLKRVKYYHQPCQQYHDLKCFHDEQQMCLCAEDHRADCFEFDHNMTYNCDGHNYCENGAK
ncbi:unnamed protein product [Didymodactylos carnosus]|uniref:Uncharacterized protein n=1 Tax=Didymodactylos carnosus TaxID=1234261 RepID=A0A814PC68_9BILA|nr:unnamed protein product [Didymodactylos carnosus]CAF1105892.1 unnamed protein product [Didymodactylos carnosus]CAF3722543.1 unnamed protein product [Didymodactylos carnosus]CAF3870560.1 unnamed protein product [Didymodactylos carnosus]